MAKGLSFKHTTKKRTKKPGVHSKNASRSQNGYKKQYKGQGK